ncbi:uncharacterized protein [Phyllobates terribilis]|uniref:uncharacterized protein n=1 Tax=Phyllobates terribilis TaxID=111132 RepID=UPI003CCB2178
MAVLLACASFLLFVPEVSAVRYLVGGNVGWSPNNNYTLWAKDKHFYKGDWLFFVYDRNQMNILEVNKTNYESCNTDHPMTNWTRGAGRDVVPLNMTKMRYFVSGKGFCFSGMKLAVDTKNPPPPPSAAPVKAAATTVAFSYNSHFVLSVAFAIAAVWDGLLRVI